MKTPCCFVIVVFAAIAATACATLRQPMPETRGHLALSVSKEPPSKWTSRGFPFLAHPLPNSAVFVSSGGVFTVGEAARRQPGDQTSMEKYTEVTRYLRIDMAKAAERVLAEALRKRGETSRFAAPGAAGDATLEIAPYLVMNFMEDEQFRPWVVLRAALKDARGSATWSTRYMASVAEALPLMGDASWQSAEGAPLRAAVDRAMGRAVDVLLRDAEGALRRGAGQTVKIKGQWVWMTETLEISSEVLDENAEVIVVIPKVEDGYVFAGVNVFDKRTVTITPASR
jgi:hypothetical protein